VSYEEKGTWVYLVTSAGAYVVYLVIILGRLASTPAVHVPYVAVLLWTAGASVLANTVGRTLVETARPSDIRKGDVVRAVGGRRVRADASRLPARPVSAPA